MSKNKRSNETEVEKQETEVVSETPTETVETKQEETVTETTETEAKAEEAPVENKVEPVAPAPVETKPVETVAETVPATESYVPGVNAESLDLAKELGVTAVTDVRTGQKSLPSTPAMRAYAARQAELEKAQQANAVTSVADMVKENYNAVVASNPTVVYVTTTLDEYIKRMSPKNSIDEVTGGQQQTKMARLYDTILLQQPELAQICLKIVVSAIKNNLNDAFAPLYAHRFANTVMLNQEEALRFQMLTTTFIALAEGTPKSDLNSKISVRKLLDYIPDRNAKSNMSEFLN